MTRQLDLFAASSDAEVREPRDPNASYAELAARLPSHVRLGTSSWTFPGWAGLVYHRRYPSQKVFVQESLTEYARFPLFRTVGIDRSYYGPIPAPELAAMRAQVPGDFRAVMKVWDGISTLQFADHPERGAKRRAPNPAFLDPDLFETAIAAPMRESGFVDRLGAYVIEIPSTPDRPDVPTFLGKLARFLERTPGPFAVELRDRRLFTADYLAVLRAHGASHCFNFWSRMPRLAEQLERVGSLDDAPHVVVRLMLPPGERYEQRREAFAPFDRIVDPQPGMHEDVERILAVTGGRRVPTFVIVNNKAEGSAPRTLITLASRLALPSTEPQARGDR